MKDSEMKTGLISGENTSETGNDLLELIFANHPGGMVIVSLAGIIKSCNSAGASILGYSSEELVGMNTDSLYSNVNDKSRLHDLAAAGSEGLSIELPLRHRSGNDVWVSLIIVPTRLGHDDVVLISFVDITQKKLTRELIRLNEIRFEALYALSEMLHKPTKAILDYALEASTRVTESDIGYIYFLNEDETELTLHAWSKNVSPQCTLGDYPETYMVSETGLWGEAVRQRKAIITNNYDNCPNKRGYPEGHVPITRHMNIPLIDNGKIVLLAGVGNKKTIYTDDDVRQLQLLMAGMWRTIQRQKAEQELEKAHLELEQKVIERTAKLEKMNEELAILNMQLVKKDKQRERAEQELMIYKRIVSSSPDLVSLVDRDFVYRKVNEAYLHTFKKQQDDIVGKRIIEIVGNEIFETVSRPSLDRAFAGETLQVADWLTFPGGIQKFMNVTYSPVSGTDGQIEFVGIDARDMTDFKLNEEKLRTTADRLELATKSGGIGIWELDADTGLITMDPLMQELYKVDLDEFTNMHQAWRSRLHPDDLARVEKEKDDAMAHGNPFDSEFRIIWPDGEVRHIKSSATVELDEHGRTKRLIGVNQDVTKRRRLESRLLQMAITDPLTGAYNHRFFMDRAVEEYSRCKRYDYPLTVLSLDIDHFKRINDTFGHPIGDEILKALVAICKQTFRATDFFARMGGEEFSAILPQTYIESAIQVADRLLLAVENSCPEFDGDIICYTVSIGLSQVIDSDSSVSDVLKRTDDALYKAKRAGRNRLEIL